MSKENGIGGASSGIAERLDDDQSVTFRSRLGTIIFVVEAWCRSCGGPIRDGRCENCETAPLRREEGRRSARAARAAVKAWIEGITAVYPGDDPIESLLAFLLSESDEEGTAEVLIDIHERTIRVIREGAVDRVLVMPLEVALRMLTYFEVLRVRQSVEGVEGGAAFAFERNGLTFRVRPSEKRR